MTLEGYAPFFREGLLYLPQKTIELLLDLGLDPKLAKMAQTGLRLDDNRAQIGLISNQLEKALEKLAHQPHIRDQLTSDEARFMLSDMDEDKSAGT